MAVTVTPAAVLVLLLLSFSGPLHASPPEPVPLTLLDCATEKGAGARCSSHVGFFLQSIMLEIIYQFISVCLDGTPPGYHLQRGYGSGSTSWLIFLEVTY
jgi:hypothetical protein